MQILIYFWDRPWKLNIVRKFIGENISWKIEEVQYGFLGRVKPL